MSGKGKMNIKDTAVYRRLLKKRETMPPEQRAVLDTALADLEIAAERTQAEGNAPSGEVWDLGGGFEAAITAAFVSSDNDFYGSILDAIGCNLVDDDLLSQGGEDDDLYPVQ